MVALKPDEVEEAIQTLGNPGPLVKMVWITVLKRNKEEPWPLNKLFQTFTNWITKAKTPQYIKHNKIFALSKTGEQFPPEG